MLPCQGCAYKSQVPGSAHIRCNFDWEKTDGADFPEHQGSENARQWFIFPFNYDPVWGPNECSMKTTEADPEKTAESNPMADLMSIMGKRAFR